MTIMMKKITAEPDVLASNKIADHNKSVGPFLPKFSAVTRKILSRTLNALQCCNIFYVTGQNEWFEKHYTHGITCQFGCLSLHLTENAAALTTALVPPHPVA